MLSKASTCSKYFGADFYTQMEKWKIHQANGQVPSFYRMPGLGWLSIVKSAAFFFTMLPMKNRCMDIQFDPKIL